MDGARRKPFLTRCLSYGTPVPISLLSTNPSAWKRLSPKFMRRLRNLYQKASIDLLQRGRAAGEPGALVRAHHQNRTGGMADNRIRDTPLYCPPYPLVAPAAHHD